MKHKRKFKGWVIVRPDGEVMTGAGGLPMMWRLGRFTEANRLIKYGVGYDRKSTVKRVTIVVCS